jgi:predicted nucleic acid-binding protein
MVTILDASVAIKWFVRESGHEAALAVLANLFAGPKRFAVPELFFFELVHVFNRLIPDPPPDQWNILHAVLDCGLPRFAMTPTLATEVRKLQTAGLSGYDAAYVALARELRGTWLTCDEKAHQKIKAMGISRILTA